MSFAHRSAAAVRGAAAVARRCVDAVMPVACIFCGVECMGGERGICSGCFGDLPWLGPRCGRCAAPLAAMTDEGLDCADCQRSPPPFTAAAAAFHYEFPVDAAIRALKFHRRLDYVPVFGRLLASMAAALPDDIDGVLPVPLHWRRQFRRGYNQAAELARPVARAQGLLLVGGVRRLRPTRYQTGLSATERRLNVEAAFGVRGTLQARHVLIVDDVVTTAATCRQLAQALLAAGAREVSLLAVARAGQAGLNA